MSTIKSRYAWHWQSFRFVSFVYLIIRLAENSSKVISIPIHEPFQLLVAGEFVKREVRIVVLRMCAAPSCRPQLMSMSPAAGDRFMRGFTFDMVPLSSGTSVLDYARDLSKVLYRCT